jgi:hypothetical protein
MFTNTARNLMCTLSVFVALIATVVILPLSCSTADAANDTHYIKYSVSDQLVSIVSATTPYDSNPKARDAFIHWFERGFNTVLTGKTPLMIEWKNSLEGKAGQRGYDFGMNEAERYLKKQKETNQSPHKNNGGSCSIYFSIIPADVN